MADPVVNPYITSESPLGEFSAQPYDHTKGYRAAGGLIAIGSVIVGLNMLVGSAATPLFVAPLADLLLGIALWTEHYEWRTFVIFRTIMAGFVVSAGLGLLEVHLAVALIAGAIASIPLLLLLVGEPSRRRVQVGVVATAVFLVLTALLLFLG
jgi:hypothetical protein